MTNGESNAEAPGSGCEPVTAESTAADLIAAATRITTVQIVLILLGTIPFLYFARPVILPICLACVAAMTLKPLIRWLACCRIAPALSAAIVLGLLLTGIGIG